jgi:hypothetical protein
VIRGLLGEESIDFAAVQTAREFDSISNDNDAKSKFTNSNAKCVLAVGELFAIANIVHTVRYRHRVDGFPHTSKEQFRLLSS